MITCEELRKEGCLFERERITRSHVLLFASVSELEFGTIYMTVKVITEEVKDAVGKTCYLFALNLTSGEVVRLKFYTRIDSELVHGVVKAERNT